MSANQIAVIAGNQSQYDRFLSNIHHEDRLHFRYIRRSEDCQGMVFERVIRIGSWYRHPEKKELFTMALARCI